MSDTGVSPSSGSLAFSGWSSQVGETGRIGPYSGSLALSGTSRIPFVYYVEQGELIRLPPRETRWFL